MRFPGSASCASRVVSLDRYPPIAPPRAARPSIFGIAVVIVGLALAGCGVRLAPDFDRTMVDGLARANEETMTLFAMVASGTSNATFPRRERTYNELIGKFDALRLQAQVRPNPQAPVGIALIIGNNQQAQQRVAEATSSPTPGILAVIRTTIVGMRDTDRRTGLDPRLVPGFKNQYETAMEQALKYEKALER
jgi:hypothetical protein